MAALLALILGVLSEILFFALLTVSVLVFVFRRMARSSDRRIERWRPGQPLPTVLIHGYLQNPGNWIYFERVLRSAGVRSQEHLLLWPPLQSIETHAARLAALVKRTIEQTGAPQVNLVGHSMGGLVSRWYLQKMGGAPDVAQLITLASPHHGTIMAFAGIGACAREMRPNSPLVRELALSKDRLGAVRVISYYSNLDQLVIPSSSGRMGAPATDRLVPYIGHSAFVFLPGLARLVAAELAAGTSAEQSNFSG